MAGRSGDGDKLRHTARLNCLWQNRVMPLTLALLLLGLTLQEQHHDLRDQECSAKQLLIGELDGVAVYARCSSANGNRTMEISITTGGRPDAGPLESFTLGFCGNPVITAASPNDWESELSGGERTYVTWRINAQRAVSNASGAVTGFSLVMKPGWMRSRYMSVQRGDNAAGVAGGAGTSLSHDCRPMGASRAILHG
jgi:hypothetical protein